MVRKACHITKKDARDVAYDKVFVKWYLRGKHWEYGTEEEVSEMWHLVGNICDVALKGNVPETNTFSTRDVALIRSPFDMPFTG